MLLPPPLPLPQPPECAQPPSRVNLTLRADPASHLLARPAGEKKQGLEDPHDRLRRQQEEALGTPQQRKWW